MSASHKAISIPIWVRKLQGEPQDQHSIYAYLPALMQWRSFEYMELMLLKATFSISVKHQLEEILTHVKVMLLQVDLQPLVARISMSKHVPNEITVAFAPDVKIPAATGHVVLRMDDNGRIKGVVREYSMSYTVNKPC